MKSNFEYIKAMSLEELANWLDKTGQLDSLPWIKWFTGKYCSNCESIKCKYADIEPCLSSFCNSNELDCAYCELEKKCRFFLELADIPDNLEIIKMWLNEVIE